MQTGFRLVHASFSIGDSGTLVIGQTSLISGSSGTTASTLYIPEGIAFDSHGNLWVADSDNSRILEFKPPFYTGESASIVIGQTSFTSGSFGTTASTLNSPEGIAFDSAGNLWVADSGNNRVLEFSAGNLITNGFATNVIGQTSFTSGSFGTTANTLNSPVGIAFDSAGNLWVADSGNNRILEFTANNLITGASATNVIGQTSFNLGSSGTTANTLHYPEGIAFGSAGNLWVADLGNNRVLEFSANNLITGASATNVIGQTSFNLGSSGTTANTLYSPKGIAFDSAGNLWVADSGNNRVLEFSAGNLITGASATNVIGQTSFTSGSFGTTANTLNSPVGIAFDSAGNLWVADVENNRVIEFTNTIIQNNGGSNGNTGGGGPPPVVTIEDNLTPGLNSSLPILNSFVKSGNAVVGNSMLYQSELPYSITLTAGKTLSFNFACTFASGNYTYNYAGDVYGIGFSALCDHNYTVYGGTFTILYNGKKNPQQTNHSLEVVNSKNALTISKNNPKSFDYNSLQAVLTLSTNSTIPIIVMPNLSIYSSQYPNAPKGYFRIEALNASSGNPNASISLMLRYNSNESVVPFMLENGSWQPIIQFTTEHNPSAVLLTLEKKGVVALFEEPLQPTPETQNSTIQKQKNTTDVLPASSTNASSEVSNSITQESQSSTPKHNNDGVIFAIGGVIVLIIIILVLYLLFAKKRKRRRPFGK